MFGKDNTEVVLTADKKHLRCQSSGGVDNNSCGQYNKPPVDQQTAPLVLLSALMDPQGEEAYIQSCLSGWHRNQYTVQGTFYHVWIKVRDATTG